MIDKSTLEIKCLALSLYVSNSLRTVRAIYANTITNEINNSINHGQVYFHPKLKKGSSLLAQCKLHFVVDLDSICSKDRSPTFCQVHLSPRLFKNFSILFESLKTIHLARRTQNLPSIVRHLTKPYTKISSPLRMQSVFINSTIERPSMQDLLA